MMFYVLTILVVGAVICVLVVRHNLLKTSVAEAEIPVKRFPRLDAITQLALGAGFVILVVTGLFIAGGLTGLFLLLHVFGGAVFAVSLAAMVVLRAEANSRLCSCQGGGIGLCVERMFFWALAATGLCMILTAVLAMMPLLGTLGQVCIATVHKYVSILAFASGLGYGYFAVLRSGIARAKG